MSKNSSNSNGGGLGFCGALTIAFIVLKLCHVIEWSWFWVLSPTIFAPGLAFIIFLVMFIVAYFD